MERRGMTPDYEIEIRELREENEELKKKIESYEKACKEIANKSPKNHINNCSLNDINEYINKLTDELFEIISPENLIICEVYKLVKKKMKGE